MAAPEVLCRTAICSNLYVCRSGDWSRIEEQLQQRSARAFRPFDARSLRPQTLTSGKRAETPPPATSKPSRSTEVPFRYPHAFYCFATTSCCCGIAIFDPTHSTNGTFATMKLVRYVTYQKSHARKLHAERLLEGGARNDLTDRMMQIPHEMHQRDRHSGAQDR